MGIKTEKGQIFSTARAAAVDLSGKIARKLAEAHRDEILQGFTANPGRNALTRTAMKKNKLPPSVSPSNRTFALHDSLKVAKTSGKKDTFELRALEYWRYAMEFGSYLNVKGRRIDPPLVVSTASEKVWQNKEKIVKTKLEVFAVRVTGTSTGGA